MRTAVVFAIMSASLVAAAERDEGGEGRAVISLEGAPSMGPDDAVVTVVEFSDFYCPHCRRANETLATLMRVYPSQLRVVYRHSLLDADRASLAAQASLAAASRGQFWAMHDRLFAGQAPTTAAALAELAGDIGLDPIAIRAELENGTHAARLAEDIALAKSLGISGVPVFFVNGRRLIGAQPLGEFVRVIEEEIALAGTTRGAARVGPRDAEAAQFVPIGRIANQRGGSQPLVEVVEFSDYGCRYCRRVHPLVGELADAYGKDFRVSFRHFPLGGRTLVAEAAEEAGAQGKFWEFTKRVFDGDQPTSDREMLLAHARAIGLDLAAFERALNERSHARLVAADLAEAAGLGVTGTPTFFFNGRKVVGALSLDEFRAIIDDELAVARKALAGGVSRSELYRNLCSRPAP